MFVLVPLPDETPRIPLKEGPTEVGRKILTDQLHITSQTHPKKMSVSRKQILLTVTGNTVILESIGLNTIILSIGGKVMYAERNKRYIVNPGDTFTLCGQHFPFKIDSKDPKEPRIKQNIALFDEKPQIGFARTYPAI